MSEDLKLTDHDLSMAFQIESFLESEGGKYLLSYIALQWEKIIEDASKAKTEPNWRAQQGILKGFRMCWDIPFKIVKRSRDYTSDERRNEETEAKEAKEAYAP